MSKQLINSYNTTGTNRFGHLIKMAGQSNTELPFRHVALISRILFAVFIIGFIGYFFDRLKQSATNIGKKAKTNSY